MVNTIEMAIRGVQSKDFTKLPAEEQKNLLDKGGLDTLLKFSLLQKPKAMENPISLMLLMGAVGRQ